MKMVPEFDLVAHLTRQAAFSFPTFGPGPRTAGILKHIETELSEVVKARTPKRRSQEWVDLVILSLDGLLRSIQADMIVKNETMPANHMIAARAAQMILEKQSINESRSWPDWRVVGPDKPIEHNKPGQAVDAPTAQRIFEAGQKAERVRANAGPKRKKSKQEITEERRKAQQDEMTRQALAEEGPDPNTDDLFGDDGTAFDDEQPNS